MPPRNPVTTTRWTQNSSSSTSNNYVLSAVALGAMQIFTLSVWAHLKINVN